MLCCVCVILCLAREWWAYTQVDWWGIIRGDKSTWRQKCENWVRGERDCKSEFSHWMYDCGWVNGAITSKEIVIVF